MNYKLGEGDSPLMSMQVQCQNQECANHQTQGDQLIDTNTLDEIKSPCAFQSESLPMVSRMELNSNLMDRNTSFLDRVHCCFACPASPGQTGETRAPKMQTKTTVVSSHVDRARYALDKGSVFSSSCLHHKSVIRRNATCTSSREETLTHTKPVIVVSSNLATAHFTDI